MAWVMKLEEIVDGKVVSRRKIGTIEKPDLTNSVDDIGLRISEGKALLSSIQQTLVESQFDRDGKASETCATCGR